MKAELCRSPAVWAFTALLLGLFPPERPGLGFQAVLAAQELSAPFAAEYARLKADLEALLDFQAPFVPASVTPAPATSASPAAAAPATSANPAAAAPAASVSPAAASPGAAEKAAAPAAKSPSASVAEKAATTPAAATPAAAAEKAVGPTATAQTATAGRSAYTLADLIAQALSTSPLIRSAQASRRAAEADLQSAKAQRLPTFALDTSASYLGNPLGPIVIKKGELGSFNNPQDPNGSTILVPPLDTTIYKGMEASLYQFKISSDLPLFTWGKIATGIEAALSALGAARIKEAQAAHELRYRLQGTWEALAYVVRTEAVLGLQKQAGDRLVVLARESYRSGFITKSELLKTEIKIKEIEVGEAMAVEKRNRLLSDLSYLTGLKNLALSDLSLSAEPASRPRQSLQEALDLMPRYNYDLAYGRAMLEAQESMQRLAEIQGRGLPDIGLHLEASYGGSRFPFFETDWYGKDDYQFTLSLGTKGNLFGNPVKAGEALKAKAQTEDTIAQLTQGEQNLASFIREQYLTLDLQKSRLEYAQLKLGALQEELEQQKQLLLSGSGQETDYLAKLLECLSALADAYSQLATYRSTLLTLEAAGSDGE
ncbi:TolC family protein [Gracilinema caldarium]|uniref:TolC family protein n=1 Tax=Gracilinema caldarium TaxID=215591 RepID=UPI0026EDD0B2|nr:TolC family protein [Gracilinema caldarium]